MMWSRRDEQYDFDGDDEPKGIAGADMPPELKKQMATAVASGII